MIKPPAPTAKTDGKTQGGRLAAPPHTLSRAFLFIDVQHGLGNRLRALASAAVIADRTERHLIVIWRPDLHCQATIGELLRYDCPVIEADTDGLLRARCDHVYNYMEIEPGAVFHAPILDGDDPTRGDVYVRSAETLRSRFADRDAEDRFLRGLRPTQAVLDLVSQVRHPSDIAVHIRMATGPAFDHLPHEAPANWPAERHLELTQWREKSDLSRFIKRLDAMLASGEIQTIFAAADLPATYSALIERYGDRIRYQPRTAFDRSSAQLQTALADMMLLTAAPRFLASTWSSFSDVTQRLARPGRRFEQSGVHF